MFGEILSDRFFEILKKSLFLGLFVWLQISWQLLLKVLFKVKLWFGMPVFSMSVLCFLLVLRNV